MEVEFVNIHLDIVNQCKAGNTTAYKRLYDLYSKAMFNVCLRITNDHEEAEDVLQEAFINAFKNIHSYRGDSTFGTWLKRIVVNKALNHLKKKKLDFQPLADFHDHSEDNDASNYAASQSIENIKIASVKNALKKLPDGYRTVLSLYLIEGYDHGEIAQIMNISESTSKSQYNRAKKKLRELI